MSNFLLLLGVSGVGKSAIIKNLLQLDNRFVYITPYMTRPLRKGEVNKISISDEQMDSMWSRGDFLAINELYGIRYATPRLPITQALIDNKFPVLDWPISRIEIVTKIFQNQLFIVYVSPPSIEVLNQRLFKDKRDIDGSRMKSAQKELEAYWAAQYSGVCHLEIVAEENQVQKIAQEIYAKYLLSFSSD